MTIEKDEKDSKGSDDSKDNSEVVDPDKKGNSDDSGKKEEDLSFEEITYKERYGKSTEEFQKLKAIADKREAKLREKFGLSDDDDLDAFLEAKEDKDAKDDSKKDSDKDSDHDSKKDSEDDSDEDDSDDDDNDDEDEEDAKKKTTEDKDDKNSKDEEDDKSSKLSVRDMVDKSERTAMDLTWDRFSEKHPEVETDAKLREKIIKNFNRFRQDEAGNDLSLREALEETFFYANARNEIEKGKKEAYNKALLDAKKNEKGTMRETSGKKSETPNKKELSQAEKKMARSFGMSEEEYLKHKSESGDDDYDDDDE